MSAWQYTNEFFEEGCLHYMNEGKVTECPYNYLQVAQDDEKAVQQELYRQQEWLAGFRFQHELQLSRA